ncbi:hypothetical protein C0989_011215 [Termitomyces sp. Mn162]|nr:hypothetical protein C0989_011215 [Termitomyces sp. Mn162]
MCIPFIWMDSSLSTLPEICISFAPPQEAVAEPYSPFSATCATPIDDDAFRSVHLTPPPTLTVSPLRPSDNATVQGLRRERFEDLIQTARERNLVLGFKKGCDLRKEIALKAHKNKQVERRALFLSKVLAPPSPTSALTAKTLPESPAHYSLPSPGLVSPFAMFESSSEDAKNGVLSRGHEPWVEQVDLRTSQSHISTPPSLDQISARMTSRSHARRPRLQIGVGRLQMPIRATTHTDSDSRKLHDALELQAPEKQSNLISLSSREHRAHNMLSMLGRRTSSFERRLDGVEPEVVVCGAKWKRHSASGDILPLHERSGFEHPVLSLPGGF